MKKIIIDFKNDDSITIDYYTALNSIVNTISTYPFEYYNNERIIELLNIPNKFIEKVSENENDDIVIRVNDEEDFNYYILYGLKEKIEKEINSRYV